MRRFTRLFALALLAAMPAAIGCPVCDTATGQQVRAGIVDGQFLLLRPTFVSPYFSPEASNFFAQVSARPRVKIAQLETGLRTGRPSDDPRVVGHVERG